MSDFRQPAMSDFRQQDYERAGLAGHLTPGTSPALLLVDPARA